MRKLLALVIVGLVAAACGPGLTPGRIGFRAAQAPTFGQLTINPNPAFFGEASDSVAGWWNAAAHRPLFAVTNGPALINFAGKTPIIASPEPGTIPGPRVVAYAEQHRNADGSMASCTVYYDPSFVAAFVPGRHLSTFVFAHEVGHCLELFGHDQNRDAVMALDRFWDKAFANMGPNGNDTLQLKMARYIA